MENDTIAAIATAMGESSIAIIRVSGQEALTLVDHIYQGKNKLIEATSHTVQYGHIVHPSTNEKVDEVLVTVMMAPRTFTRENVVEISCHGGLIAVEQTLELLLSTGVRLAEPGEFTKRAFLNGRIDLSQAEAVIDLIRAKTDKAAKVAIRQSEGKLSTHIRSLRSEIVETLAHLAVNVDYPEYDADVLTGQFVVERCKSMQTDLERLLQTARQGKILREGIATAIIGRPNVGKSSLMNALTQENKAIVTDIPGTTRDVIEEYVNVRGIPLKLLDTAGIRETEDIVEQIGVKRSEKALQSADLVLFMINHAESLQKEDLFLLEKIKAYPSLIIINKTDLPQQIDYEVVQAKSGNKKMIPLSVKTENGLDQLEEAIKDMFFAGNIDVNDQTYVSNARHIQLLEQAKASITEVISGVEQGIPLDMAEIDMKNAWQSLGEVIGEAVAEDLIDQIFSQFCLGK
ncbi:tRNA uridine-5-carboxymethylaminomethyl(34) synthesis GTPase MnmE [Shimazuella kribbensis]|uniref:tRNA uridine-5-carboxymethylaminomethyl(34) synthesis GTPase MnmE n=1 Tax=Shimazuella kribbensis TaxID=139808 RepID=UPI0004136AA3|nr:tRNA uridine-5-carboxymethylaminomethyl(34) synthesis GTPase MnmE [Shimazuella kribbensis]